MGAGAGAVFKGSVATVIQISPAETRAEALAGLFLAGYVGLSIPVVGAGIALQFTSAKNTLLGFAILEAVAILAAAPRLLGAGAPTPHAATPRRLRRPLRCSPAAGVQGRYDASRPRRGRPCRAATPRPSPAGPQHRSRRPSPARSSRQFPRTRECRNLIVSCAVDISGAATPAVIIDADAPGLEMTHARILREFQMTVTCCL